MRADRRKSRRTDHGCYAKSAVQEWFGSLATRLHSFIRPSGSVGRDFFPPSRSYKSSISNRPILFLPPFPLVAFLFRPFRGEAKISRMKASCPSSLTGGGPALSLTPCRADDRFHSGIRVAGDKPFRSRKIELLRIGICPIRGRQRGTAAFERKNFRSWNDKVHSRDGLPIDHRSSIPFFRSTRTLPVRYITPFIGCFRREKMNSPAAG